MRIGVKLLVTPLHHLHAFHIDALDQKGLNGHNVFDRHSGHSAKPDIHAGGSWLGFAAERDAHHLNVGSGGRAGGGEDVGY
jgi:hypothetical protein